MPTKNTKHGFKQEETESVFDYEAKLIEHTFFESSDRARKAREPKQFSYDRYHRAGVPNGTIFSITSTRKIAGSTKLATSESDSTLDSRSSENSSVLKG